ncbi:ribonucleoside-diphosphate reductase subunit alpha [Candidatus Chromulinivorax destructor]|uniref:Ribonucleoside-diphosphate reductase n=1 Tax=Candidatus Chromulinivorax destructor TaxID=2066483 RepID=A0A345ZBF9_9BACT|nr:ribonucleoside-diphosphate reductase subunit alpha [Candidatus Chromulinivorax destructor]AXK60626.1 ribonucleoside-diphosphate reductase subunit alpha [Candidatus Chromulinivorax destructor]
MVNQNTKLFDKNFYVTLKDMTTVSFSSSDIKKLVARAALGYELQVDIDKIVATARQSMFDFMSMKDFNNVIVLATVPFSELDQAYSFVAARLLNHAILYEVTGQSYDEATYQSVYQSAFMQGIHRGIDVGLFDAALLSYDLAYLAQALQTDRDDLFGYLGLKTIYAGYLQKFDDVRFELPQAFWMRIAMGLAMNEQDKNKKAVEFYDLLSKMLFVSSTPTLLHAGQNKAQLSSCYITFVDDDLHHIFKCIGDNAQMSKWSGGVANDWTALRGTGAMVTSINTCSQGVIPFLNVANSTTAAINRSGSRRGAVCAYLESWHYDFEDFLDLRRNTGDERRRTHDMNTAAWIPDLFMKRIEEDAQWTLFSPEETPDLHEIYGKKFEEQYVMYEQMAEEGKIKLFKKMPAKQLWRKLLTRLFETGHPWPTFKDACNVRSPQDHVGVIHSSNLCTEITLNTSREETAVCNIGSLNLAKFIKNGEINEVALADAVKIAMRMLDNVIDINFYPTIEGQVANQRHRPVGLGVMGLQDALFQLRVPFDSQEAMDYSDQLIEMVSYYAILASSQLAQERGQYASFKGSKWDRNIFPIDTIALLSKERGMQIPLLGKETKDWSVVRQAVQKYGMRNSNTMAIAPTATISNISGSFPCIEPIYKNLYAKANSSGEFAVLNSYLVDDLKKLNLWNEQMRDRIKYYDGSIQQIEEIPADIRSLYKTAFEIDPEWMVKMTAARGKWIDQSQSHNVFMQGVSGKKLHDVYMAGWKLGLKTFYYLRTLAVSQVEKSTLDAQKYGFTQMREYKDSTTAPVVSASQDNAPTDENQEIEEVAKKSCRLIDPSCDSCQ